MFLKNGYLKVETEFYHMDEYCINGLERHEHMTSLVHLKLNYYKLVNTTSSTSYFSATCLTPNFHLNFAYSKNETSLEVHVCRQDCQGPRPCIRKCCGLDKVYSIGFSGHGAAGKGCQNPDTEEYFNPVLFSDFVHEALNPGALAPHYIEKYPSSFKYECHENKTSLSVFPKVRDVISEHKGYNMTGLIFRVKEDGKILFREPDGKCSVVDPANVNICVDGIINYGAKPHPHSNDPEELVIFMCSLSPPAVSGF